MRDHPYLDLAALAGNLDERTRIVAALEAAGRRPPAGPLAPFDAWKIDRLAGRLAAKFAKEALNRSASARHDKDGLAAALTAYRLHELGLDDAGPETRAILAATHECWLPTYQAALDRFGGPTAASRGAAQAPTRPGTADRAAHAWITDERPGDLEATDDRPSESGAADDRVRGDRAGSQTDTGTASGAAGPSWRAFDVYYGRLAKACEPFLIELGRRLEDACARHPGRFDPRLIDDFQAHLLDRFELSLAWAVEAHANVHCAEHHVDRAGATREDYLAYVDATFADAAAYHRFYLRFPVLGRWLAHVTALLADFGERLVHRLAADTSAIAAAFFDEEIAAFRSVRQGRSDPHAGARTVAFVEVELASGRTASFVYKPRCIRAEAAVQGLLERLRSDGVLGFASRPVLPRQGYGYEALIPAGRNRVDSPEEAEQVYRELGGHLAIFYVLGGGDLHFENIIVADGHAHVCDCETALGVLPRGQARPLGTLLDSVFKTGLLEWPRARTSAAEMRVSGYSGGEAYDMPVPVPSVNEHRLSFAASVTHRAGVHVEPEAANRVFLGDRLTRPEDFADAIMAGFDRVYAWFEQRPDAAIRLLSDAFGGASARFINWGTQIYSQLLVSARHPRCLVDPLEVDLLVNTVRTFPRTWDDEGVLADREIASMWRLDVPIFTTDVHGDHLVHDHTTELPASLDLSPVDYAARRIRRLSARNRVQQGQYIAAGLAVGEVSSPAFVTTSLDYATRIGERLCAMLREPSAPAPWTSYDLAGGTLTEVDVDGDLYHGSGGIALFLAYLDALVPRPEFRRAAERAVSHAVSATDRTRIGAFDGLGGLVYVLTHLHHLWDDRGLLELAVRLSRDLSGRIDADTRFDVLGGGAGVIPVVLGLTRMTDGQGLDDARRCADRLLRHAVADGDVLSWPLTDPGEASANLTGFAHGAGGIGWALIQLGALAGRPSYVDAGRRAFAYEARHYDDTEHDWYDLRTNAGGPVRQGRHYANAWCNGAAGIGLSRIASWATLGGTDEALLREAHQALAATMRNFPRLMNDTLCHGRSGNAELFLRFARLRDEPAFQLEANVQVRGQWRNVDDADTGLVENTAGFFPGLMVGMSGFGMHFLRLAAPGRVPSVLLLDPPPAPGRS
ncbi:type 2 lanthipeptide synthetase LanM family protein [Actinoallomurus purpureus]|uniref:type 2 lanthipeptide synthetase LanM family protein n=1 Tax=Actinoallomurus purpureus TaxID=478114 RepID=UPI0020934ED9|nr:type 2 lanthipeptide synthetase LanM family protein [Actinoallomurus purpureus]MCO6003415.1 type 2 lanthipeptide synthetase LanM family protein [Actinoallomurus purpureus]